MPREELDELRFSDNDSRSLGTREHLPSSEDASCQPVNQQEDGRTQSQSGKRITEGGVQGRLLTPIREQKKGGTAPAGHTHSSHTQAPPPQSQAPPPVHRKAHRKTNRRKTSDSSSSSTAHRSPGHNTPSELRPSVSLGHGPCPAPDPRGPSELRPWLSWQKERREAHKEEAFPDHTDPLDQIDQTIEEVRVSVGVSVDVYLELIVQLIISFLKVLQVIISFMKVLQVIVSFMKVLFIKSEVRICRRLK